MKIDGRISRVFGNPHRTLRHHGNPKLTYGRLETAPTIIEKPTEWKAECFYPIIGLFSFQFYPIRFVGRDSEIAPTVGRFDLTFALIGELNDPTQ